MKIVFDQGVQVPLRERLLGHEIVTACELGWDKLQNGALIQAVEGNGYEVLLTTDQNLKYQQNLQGRKLSIVVLRSTSWPRIQRGIEAVLSALSRASAGSYEEVSIL